MILHNFCALHDTTIHNSVPRLEAFPTVIILYSTGSELLDANLWYNLIESSILEEVAIIEVTI